MAAADHRDALLYAWISPSFPVGAFAYSHGLEAAVEAGDIHDVATLAGWLTDLVDHGSLRTDATLASAAWKAAQDDNAVLLGQVNDLALALCPSRERFLETIAQGNAFVAIVRSAWPEGACAFWPNGDMAYPVAFGSACANASIERSRATYAVAFGIAQNLVSAGLRLGVIGQTDGQRITARLTPRLVQLGQAASRATLDDLGGCAFRSDVASMRHETQYSRLFRS